MTKPADSDQIAKARRISEIAEREKKATAGEWLPDIFGLKVYAGEPKSMLSIHGALFLGVMNGSGPSREQCESNVLFAAHARADIPFLLSELASERQAVIEDCCKAVCDCCGKYAQYWHPAELVNGRWRHVSTKVPDEGKPTTHLCDAAAIRSME